MQRDQLKRVQWQANDGGWKIGYVRSDVVRERVLMGCVMVLVQHLYDPLHLEWIDERRLTPYPDEPIEEPTK
jgi:hypothetical protein